MLLARMILKQATIRLLGRRKGYTTKHHYPVAMMMIMRGKWRGMERQTEAEVSEAEVTMLEESGFLMEIIPILGQESEEKHISIKGNLVLYSCWGRTLRHTYLESGFEK